MHQLERGTGPKLLLVHGLGGSSRSWSPVLDALSVTRTVIALDAADQAVERTTIVLRRGVAVSGQVDRDDRSSDAECI